MIKMNTCQQCGHAFYTLKRHRSFCNPECRVSFNSTASAPVGHYKAKSAHTDINTEININPANLDGASTNDQGNNRAA